MVTEVGPGRVTVRRGDKTEEIITPTIFWGAGVKASMLGSALAKAAHVEMDRTGRILVNPDMSVPGHGEIFVIGDLASFSHQDTGPLPGLAPVAMQQGKYVAKVILNRLASRPTPPFYYRDCGTMATIGRHRAVAVLRGWRLSGYIAWLAWLFIHLMYRIEFQNRVLVVIQWAWNYLTWNRNARLITGTEQASAHHIYTSEKEHVDIS
jgi:NADH:ubiquinone reductase (H+-translocating)